MIVAHSPGPWHWQPFRTMRHLFGAAGVCLKVSAPMRGNKSYGSPTPEDEANLRLIEAAPDLLAACIRANALLDNLMKSVPWGQTHDLDIAGLNEVMCQLPKVIHKATAVGDQR
jgi:hypothetical protein